MHRSFCAQSIAWTCLTAAAPDCLQVLLRWSLQKGYVPLPKSTKPERQRENISVFDVELSQEDMEYLDSLEMVSHCTLGRRLWLERREGRPRWHRLLWSANKHQNAFRPSRCDEFLRRWAWVAFSGHTPASLLLCMTEGHTCLLLAMLSVDSMWGAC